MKYLSKYNYSKPNVLSSTPAVVILVAIIYVILAKAGFLLTIAPEKATPVFFASGFALAAALIWGRVSYYGIWIGAFYSNTLFNFNIQLFDEKVFLNHLIVGFFIAFGTVLGAFISSYVVNRFCKEKHPLYNGQNVLILLVLGSTSYATITSSIGIFSFLYGGTIESAAIWDTLKTWWLGDVIGIILFAPFILVWFLKDSLNTKKIKILELLIFSLVTILLCIGIFFEQGNLQYLLLPLLFWSAYRFSALITTIVIIMIALFAIISTSQRIGPFVSEYSNHSINDSILLLDLFLSIITICSLFLSAIISERVRAEEAIIKSEEKYRNIFENMQDVFFQTDLNGCIQIVSPSSKELVEFETEELIGQSDSLVYYDYNDRQILFRELEVKGIIKNAETILITKSGLKKYISLDARLIYDSNKKPTHIDGFIRDITQKKENEIQIANQNEKLQLQNKELEQFIYITSHDLQEPLLTLKCFSELIKEEFPKNIDESLNQYVNFIVDSSDRMQKLIKGLLDYSRIGNQIEIAKVNCNEIVTKILASFDDVIAKNNIEIKINPLPIIMGYALELTQLFQHLISNAIKFRKKELPLSIFIDSKSEQNHWEFSITDNGIGIEEINKEKVFIIFKRLNNREEYSGIGIGLAICKKIIEMHGGTIWVEPGYNEGTRINFTIPKNEKK